MSQEISIPTPESLEFLHEPAGIGSRFVAGIVDAILQTAIIFGLFLVTGLWTTSLRSFSSHLGMWATSAAILMFFLIFWGYHIFFEMLWNGQTPGKRSAGIRILKDGGYPIGFLDSVVRNLLRPIDFLPFSYGVGAIVVLCNSKCKRIGDFAAGTIVVKERQIEMPYSLTPQNTRIHKDIVIGGQRLTNIHELSEAEFNVLRQFMVRRHTIQKNAHAALARKIASPLVKKLGLRPELILGREEEFLEKLADAYGQ